MDVVQQHPPVQHPQHPPQQEMMPPPATPAPVPPSRKHKKKENGDPLSPAKPRRLRRSHEACARCRSKKIKVRTLFDTGWGKQKGARAPPSDLAWQVPPGDTVGLISAGLFTFAALAAIAYSAVIFVYRAYSIRHRLAEGMYYDKYGPTFLSLTLLTAIIVNIALRMMQLMGEDN